MLDNTPRSQWRVSSLQGKLFQPSLVQIFLGRGSLSQLPVLVVRPDDWRPHQELLRQRGTKIHLTWSRVTRELLGQELGCSDSNTLRISDGPQSAHQCQPGKFLNSSGEIVEKVCVRSSCTKFGGKCPTQFDFPLGQFSMEVKCELPSVSPYQFLTSGGSGPLSPPEANIVIKNLQVERRLSRLHCGLRTELWTMTTAVVTTQPSWRSSARVALRGGWT